MRPALFLLTALATSAAHAAANPFQLETPNATLTPGEAGQLTVRVVVPPKHHIYRDMTSVTVVEAEGLQVGKPVFPAGVRKADPANPGQEREQFETDVVITLPVTAGPTPATHAVELKVVYQGCKGGLCFMPARETRTVTVSVSEGPSGAR